MAAARSASRWVTTLRAVSMPIVARSIWASACRRWASSCRVSMRATTCPAVTKSPSFTRISRRRPGMRVAMSISTASMRPLPPATPAGSVAWPSRAQA
jgi:hypothetical protein